MLLWWWLKVLHIVSVVAWFSGLFYLPRLFVYHVQAIDEEGKGSLSVKRFQVMERRLYSIIMWPAAVLTTLSGTGLFIYQASYYTQAIWMHVKLAMVLLLWVYHLYSGHLIKRFARATHYHHQTFYRIFNELPTIVLIVVVSLVILKP